MLEKRVTKRVDRPLVGPLPALLVLSPGLRNRPRFLAELLGSNPYLYYAVRRAEVGLDDWLLDFVESVRSSDREFGQQTLRLLAEPGKARQERAASLAHDLAQTGAGFLVLDQADLLPADEAMRRFFEQLAHKLSGQRIVILGRYLDLRLWRPLIQQGLADILGDEGDLGSAAKPQVSVFALSGGEVRVEGLPIRDWGGPLVHQLALYLLDHPLAERDDIFQTFWPHLSTKEATNVFHVTKRKITDLLGCELTEYRGGFYFRSAGMIIHYDAQEFEQLVEHARQEDSRQAATVWRRAIRHYRTPFFSHLDMPWLIERREQLRQLYVEALVGLGRFHESNGQHLAAENDIAIGFYLRALREVPQREDLHRAVMELYARQGETTKALAQYQALSKLLSRVWKIQPARETQAVYQRLSAS